jgi:hypothetical protein
LEAAAAKAHAGLQELGADAAVHANGKRHLRGLEPFHEGGTRERIDGREVQTVTKPTRRRRP